MTSTILSYRRERETKNKIRYEAASDEPGLGTIYVDKQLAAALGNPELLTVTVEAGEPVAAQLARTEGLA